MTIFTRILLPLLLALPLPLAAPAAAAPGPHDPPIPKTANALERIYRHYGAGCFGMDWRVLRAVSQMESSQDPARRRGEKTGLFMLGPGTSKRSDCGAFIRPFRKILKCADLEDPEVNTAAAAHRLHYYLTGSRLVGFNRFRRDRKAFSAAISCPKNSAANDLVLAFVGLSNGYEALQHVLKAALRNPKACGPGEALEKAVRSFYEEHPKARIDGRQRRGARLRDCPNKEEIIGRKAYKCVDGAMGLRLLRKGLEKSSRLALGSGEDRVKTLYPRNALDHSQCPPFFEDGPNRLFKCRDRLIRVYLESTDSPCSL